MKLVKDYFKTSEHDDVDTDKVAHDPLTRYPCLPLLIGNGLLPLASAVSTVFSCTYIVHQDIFTILRN